MKIVKEHINEIKRGDSSGLGSIGVGNAALVNKLVIKKMEDLITNNPKVYINIGIDENLYMKFEMIFHRGKRIIKKWINYWLDDHTLSMAYFHEIDYRKNDRPKIVHFFPDNFLKYMTIPEGNDFYRFDMKKIVMDDKLDEFFYYIEKAVEKKQEELNLIS